MKLVIAETSTSTWSYHLREVVGGKMHLGGGAPAALCGARVGWDTRIPIAAWGRVTHLPETWCRRCEEVAGPAAMREAMAKP